MHADFLTSLAR